MVTFICLFVARYIDTINILFIKFCIRILKDDFTIYRCYMTYQFFDKNLFFFYCHFFSSGRDKVSLNDLFFRNGGAFNPISLILFK